jgi:hypothetical protein
MGAGLTVRPISAAEHLAFVQAQRSVSFLQTPAWGRVKTEWRSESLGWYDGRQLVGAGLVLHRPVPRLERFTPAYLAEGCAQSLGANNAIYQIPVHPPWKGHESRPNRSVSACSSGTATAPSAPRTAFCSGRNSRRTAGRSHDTIRTSTGPRCSKKDTWPPGRATAGAAPST